MPDRWRRILWYWLPVLLWPVGFRLAAWILFSDQAPNWVRSSDKLLHMLYYAILAFLVWRGFRFERELPPWRAALVAWIVVGGWGGADELTQHLRPHRSPDVLDWLADLTGAAHVFLIAFAETVTRRGRPDAIAAGCPES